MNCDRGFLHSFGVWTVPVCPVEIRGELAIAAPLRAAHLYSVGPFGSWPWCSHAHRRQSSGRRAHSLNRHQCHVRIRLPATSDRNSAVGW